MSQVEVAGLAPRVLRHDTLHEFTDALLFLGHGPGTVLLQHLDTGAMDVQSAVCNHNKTVSVSKNYTVKSRETYERYKHVCESGSQTMCNKSSLYFRKVIMYLFILSLYTLKIKNNLSKIA